MRFPVLLFTSLAAAAAPVVSRAQSAAATNDWSPAAGSRIRVESVAFGGQKQTGTLISATSDSVVFQPAGLANSLSLRTGEISRMEVSRGTHSRKGRGALVGFLVAGGAAAAITAATWKEQNCMFCIDFGRAGDAAVVGTGIGFFGSIAGMIIGAHRVDTWEPVALPKR